MNITAQIRDPQKKAEAIRKEGFIPSEIYGHGEQNIHIVVSEKEFVKVFKEAGESTVLTLSVGAKKYPALIHAVQRDYMTGSPRHVDFYMVRADEKITTHIPFVFEGESPAVKELGGVLVRSMTEIEVEALPADLPHDIKVSLLSLGSIGDAIHVKDIRAPKGVEFLAEEDTAIVSVAEPAPEEVIVPAEPVSEIKTEAEEKKEEKATEKSAKV